MNDSMHSAAAQIRLALCSRLALPENSPVKSFSAADYSAFERTLAAGAVSDPAELIGLSAPQLAATLSVTGKEAERVSMLLARSGQVAIEVERLSARGIWVLTRGEEAYPQRWSALLGDRAPVVLFGAGDRRLLKSRALAVIGSRNVTPESSEFACRTGRIAAQAGFAVISGGARGVDRQAMTGALGLGGQAIGILADDLTRAIREPETRQWLEASRLVLLKDYSPSAPFSIGFAMARNKLIYCLSEAAVVVASDESGGTWEGAKEDWRERWVPLFVCADEPLPSGNAELLRQGAHAVRTVDLAPTFISAMPAAAKPATAAGEPAQSTFSFD